ncbi:hypothetical protein BVRB_6g148320 [Beta vulgaris subsp. vulgaris]|nr:hypothetical protein BVRB_6g148320 [Beta vulgaris subsp. vulgaris]
MLNAHILSHLTLTSLHLYLQIPWLRAQLNNFSYFLSSSTSYDYTLSLLARLALYPSPPLSHDFLLSPIFNQKHHNQHHHPYQVSLP